MAPSSEAHGQGEKTPLMQKIPTPMIWGLPLRVQAAQVRDHDILQAKVAPAWQHPEKKKDRPEGRSLVTS
jgi:hypothetical protein